MGFADLLTDAGATMLNNWVATRSYIVGYGPSQADVAVFKAFSTAPAADKYPNAARWYKHIASHESEFATLPGDPSKAYSTYGPESGDLTINPAKAAEAEDDDDVDLFGSDDEEEDAEAARVREERLAAYAAKKALKPKVIAKSVVTMDVKPWDDETDMAALEAAVRGIEKDGLVWGASKLVAVGFGIRKLQINLVVEDDKVSLDELQEQIQEFEDYVQSSDIAAMQKLEDIYPAFPSQGVLTAFDPPKDAAGVFFKPPTVCKYRQGSDWLAMRLLEEAKMNEKILRSPHPGLGHYLGCVVDGGRIVRLAFPRYQVSLLDRLWHQTALEFPAEQRRDCMDAIKEAADHLHAMGLAHNDISPANIMFDGDGRAVLIDLDAVLPVGEKIVKGGLVAGWKGPLGDNGRECKQSSVELDVLAIQEIRTHLAEDWEKKNIQQDMKE